VAEHGAQFALIEQVQDSSGAAHRGVTRIASGGKGVGVGRVADVEPRHRLMRGRREFADDGVDLWGLDLGDRHGVHGLQRQFVAVEVDVGVHAQGHQQGQEHDVAPEKRADEDDQRRHAGEQEERLHPVGGRVPGHRVSFVELPRQTNARERRAVP